MSRHNKSKRRRRPKTTAPPVPPRAPRRIDERPERLQAPWHPFPLVELSVLVGIVCIVIGLFFSDERVLLALGVSLGALGGLDTSVREHFAGYRSHTLVLSAFPAVAAAAIAAFAGLWLIGVVPLMLAVFGLAFLGLKRVWERRTRVPA